MRSIQQRKMNHNQENEQRAGNPIGAGSIKNKGEIMIKTIILKLTHKLWNRQISRILCRAKSEGIIGSEQLHQLAAAFDPTQKHIVYGIRVNHGFKGPAGVLSAERVRISGDELSRRHQEESAEDWD